MRLSVVPQLSLAACRQRMPLESGEMSSPEPTKVYWDSCVFLSLIEGMLVLTFNAARQWPVVREVTRHLSLMPSVSASCDKSELIRWLVSAGQD